MATDLIPAANAAYPVVLHGGDEASGLADMLHQFLSQTLADSAAKVRKARRLSGTLFFHATEDDQICVQLSFHGGRIDIDDVPAESATAPALTADFISTAHLTTGERGPLSLLLRRKIRVRLRLGTMMFLIGVLSLMRIPPDQDPDRPRRVPMLAAALVVMTLLAVLAWALGPWR